MLEKTAILTLMRCSLDTLLGTTATSANAISSGALAMLRGSPRNHEAYAEVL